MGKIAFLRIQNKSSISVNIEIIKIRNVHQAGLNHLQGVLKSDEQFPTNTTGEESFGSGFGFYQKIDGDATRRIHKNGSLKFAMTTTTPGAQEGITETVKLFVDHKKWWTNQECHNDDDDDSDDDDGNHVHSEHKEGGITIATDIDDGDDDDDDDPKELRIEIRIYDSIPTQSWMGYMKDSIANTPLCLVCMPGTHDSATYDWNKELGASPDNDLTQTIQDKLDSKNGRGILGKIGSKINDTILNVVFERICKCQDMTILEQLHSGIRYLDLRVAYHNETKSFYSCHGVYCINMNDILNQILQFLQTNTEEIVILDFNHFYGMSQETHEIFSSQIVSIFQGLLVPRNELGPENTVNDYWKKNARAIVIYHHLQSHQSSKGMLWYKGVIESPWPNKNKTKELKPKLEEKFQNRHPKKFFVLQGILTPDADLIKEEIFDSKGETSIKSIASKVSSKVVDWVISDEWNKASNHNIVIVDFFQNCSMVSAIINLNHSTKNRN